MDVIVVPLHSCSGAEAFAAGVAHIGLLPQVGGLHVLVQLGPGLKLVGAVYAI